MSTRPDPVRTRMAAANPAPENANPPEEVTTAAVLLDVIDERSGEMTHSTKTQQRQTGDPQRLSRSWVWALAGGFAVVIVSVGIGGLLARGGGADLGGEPSVTTVQPPVATTTATPQPTGAGIQSGAPVQAPSSWSRMDAGDMVALDIATGPMGTVAMVGNTPSEGTTWFSEDGETWQPLAVPPGRDVVYGDPGFVICCHQTGPIAVTASSFSPDGVTWFTTPFDVPDFTKPPEPGTHESMTAVTYGNGKFVAVGEIIEIDDQLNEVRSLGVWHSNDGQIWDRVSQYEVFDPDASRSEVAFFADRFVVTGGTRVWHSPDGETWAQVAQAPEADIPSGGVYGDGGYVATGYADVAPDDYRAVIRHSTNGLSWEIVAVNPDWGDIAGVVHGDRGYLAVGWSGDTGAALWHSTDGVTWTGPVHNPEVFTDTWFHAVGYIDGRYVIFGETNRADPPHGWLFISE